MRNKITSLILINFCFQLIFKLRDRKQLNSESRVNYSDLEIRNGI